MLSNLKEILSKGNTFDQADAQRIDGILKRRKQRGEGDIPFPYLEKALDKKLAVRKYKENPDNPDCLTQLMCSFWAEVDKESSKTTIVPEFPLKSKEIKKRVKQNQMAIFNGKEWMWIEKSVDSPNLNTNEFQLREKIKKEGRQIISLETYKTGGNIHKLLCGKYFDEGETWSRVLNTDGQIVKVCFRSGGDLSIDSESPGYCREFLGGRFEEVIKKPTK